MSADINTVILVGRLVRPAELKYTQGGTAVCNFSLAVNRTRKQGDQYVDEASFFDVTLWGRQGEAVVNYLIQGKQVAIQGELKQDRWQQDGQNRSKVKVIARSLQLLGGKNSGEQGGGSAQYGSGQSQGGGPEEFEDDIPF